MDHLWIPIVCSYIKINLWLNYVMKTKCSMIAAAVLNLFIIASLNMSSVIGASFAIKVLILCNISIRNRVVGTRSNSRWRVCWLDLTWPMCLIFCAYFPYLWPMMQKFDWRRNHGSNYGFSKIDLWPMGFFRLLIFHMDTKFGAQILIGAEIMAKIRN